VFPITTSSTEDLSSITRANDALDNLKVIHSDRINLTKIYPKTNSEATNSIVFNADSERYDLIIGIAGDHEYDWALGEALILNPEQNLLHINDQIRANYGQSLSTARSIVYLEHQGSFLFGALAAMVSKTNILGYYFSYDSDKS
jgi:basic membrane lipoprotein Med (substrate-binding protein (PBP1-ABC) superfamily)